MDGAPSCSSRTQRALALSLSPPDPPVWSLRSLLVLRGRADGDDTDGDGCDIGTGGGDKVADEECAERADEAPLGGALL